MKVEKNVLKWIWENEFQFLIGSMKGFRVFFISRP